MRRVLAALAALLLLGGVSVPVYVPYTTAPTHLGAFRNGPFGTAATYVPAGKPLLPALLGGARYVVEAAFGATLGADPTTWQWFDITGDVLVDTARVAIRQGRNDEVSLTSPADCAFQLNNTSGDYSPYRPTGRWWPYVARNTPIRVRVTTDGSTAATTWYIRFQGYANGFTPSVNQMSQEPTVTVSASGALRRLQQGRTPLRSALYRAITGATTPPGTYWPLEDSAGALSAASGFSAGPPLAVTGPVVFASSVVSIPGSAGAVDLRGNNGVSASLAGLVTGSGFSSSGWQLEFVGEYASTGSTSTTVVTVQNTGTNPQNFVLAAPALRDGHPHHVAFQLTQTGADINIDVFRDGVYNNTSTQAGVTLGVPTQVVLNAYSALGDDLPIISHVFLSPTLSSPLQRASAVTAHAGETATARLARLCLEEGIAFTSIGADATAMGPQGVDTLINLLRECEATGSGLLADGLGPGLTYVALAARYNQPASMALDATADEVGYPFTSIDDDQRSRNLCKADRKNGSSATYEDASGPLGTGTIGTYDTTLTVNPSVDSDLYARAAWEVRKGTIQGLRYPTLPLDLADIPQRIPDWLATSLTERVDVANVTSLALGFPPGTVSLVVDGWTEVFDDYHWAAVANTSPYEPYRVGVLDTDRLDNAGSALATTAAAGAGSLSVACTGQVWSTAAGDYPLDFWIAGVRVTVTAVSGASSPQTFTVTASTVTRQLNAGDVVRLWSPLYPAL